MRTGLYLKKNTPRKLIRRINPANTRATPNKYQDNLGNYQEYAPDYLEAFHLWQKWPVYILHSFQTF
jgi:hypothetical protein